MTDWNLSSNPTALTGTETIPLYQNSVTYKTTAREISRVNGPVTAPASASATGVAGTWAVDSSYLYVCVAANTWKRTALSTW